METKEIINGFRKEKLPNRDAAFHYESEISSGLDMFEKWLIDKGYNIFPSKKIEELKENNKRLGKDLIAHQRIASDAIYDNSQLKNCLQEVVHYDKDRPEGVEARKKAFELLEK